MTVLIVIVLRQCQNKEFLPGLERDAISKNKADRKAIAANILVEVKAVNLFRKKPHHKILDWVVNTCLAF